MTLRTQNLALSIMIALLLSLATTPRVGRSQSQQPPQQPVLMLDVRTAVRQWQTSTNIRVAPAAENVIVDDFSAAAPRLVALMGAQEFTITQANAISQTVVSGYLYEVRDTKLVERSSPQLITADDVPAPQRTRYITNILEMFRSPVGDIAVISRPTGAAIAIGGVQYGRTNREFVAKAGAYIVRVQGTDVNLKCERSVAVKKATRTLVCCPESLCAT